MIKGARPWTYFDLKSIGVSRTVADQRQKNSERCDLSLVTAMVEGGLPACVSVMSLRYVLTGGNQRPHRHRAGASWSEVQHLIKRQRPW